MFSVVNLICSVSVLLHVKGTLVPFISATDLFPPFENYSLIVKNSRRYCAGSAFPRKVSLNFFFYYCHGIGEFTVCVHTDPESYM